jgi:riboflavin synthase
VFTGLIQARGKVAAITSGHESLVLTFDAGDLTNQMKVGDSVAVNGVCLTVTKIAHHHITVDVMIQTLRLTSLKELRVNDLLNLELSMLPTDRLGGHIVQGHVDGLGTVVMHQREAEWERLDVRIPKELLKYIVPQGSIAIAGISLTVGSVNDESQEITLWLIPETIAKTNISDGAIGSLLNIEVDILAKHLERLMEKKDK